MSSKYIQWKQLPIPSSYYESETFMGEKILKPQYRYKWILIGEGRDIGIKNLTYSIYIKSKFQNPKHIIVSVINPFNTMQILNSIYKDGYMPAICQKNIVTNHIHTPIALNTPVVINGIKEIKKLTEEHNKSAHLLRYASEGIIKDMLLARQYLRNMSK